MSIPGIELTRSGVYGGQERSVNGPQAETGAQAGANSPAHAGSPRAEALGYTELTEAEQRQLIELVRKYKQTWFLRRRMVVKRVLKAYEFFKGNHFISFDPESFQWFDAMEATFAAEDSGREDLNMYQFATNFYQMLGFAFVAALSAQMPKTRFLPENAEREEDIATARAASRVQEIVERQNNIKSLHKQGLLFLWMAGCYFRHTRYVVDSDLAGTHKEPVMETQKVMVLPERYICRQCTTTVPVGLGDLMIGRSGDRKDLGSNQHSALHGKPHGKPGQAGQVSNLLKPAVSNWPLAISQNQEQNQGPISTQHSTLGNQLLRGGASPACPGCGAGLSDNDFYPEEFAEVPVVCGTKEMPNGMVTMTLYSPLHVDAAPYAKNLRETPILNVDEEVDVAALRASYPAQWEALKGALGPMNPEAQNERMARQMIYSEEGARSNFVQDMMPTLSRTWIQPWAFNTLEDKQIAMKLNKTFPKGCLLVNAGDLFLEAREARLTDEWTWSGTIQETFGLYPPAVGDAAIPVQERINDVANLTHEYMDRIAAGLVLYNSNLIDGEALNGKALLPGVLNGVKMKQAASAMGNRLEDAIVQIRAEIDSNIYHYQQQLVFTAQLISGTPPQIFGGGGDPHIETASGQQQQLSTALGKLGLFWDNVREEHAQAAEVAVHSAAQNMTDDLVSVITDQSGQYRNQYVRLDEMEGDVHAYPETDQGFPMTFAEIKAFWEKLIEFGAGGKNPYVNAILDDPANQEQIATWTGVPGLVVPGRDMRNKVLRVLDVLVQQQPVKQEMNGQVIELPSIQPDKELDDLDVIQKTVRQWAQKNFDKQDENPAGFKNVVLYYKMADQYQQQKAAQQMAQMQAQQPQKKTSKQPS